MQLKRITNGGPGAKPPAFGQFFGKILGILTQFALHFARFWRHTKE